jgi:hypothetical protein
LRRPKRFVFTINKPLHRHTSLFITMLNTCVQVEQILDQRKSAEDGETSEYKIRWKRPGPKEDTWEPEAILECPQLLQAFWDSRRKLLDGGLKKYSSSSSSSSEGDVQVPESCA